MSFPADAVEATTATVTSDDVAAGAEVTAEVAAEVTAEVAAEVVAEVTAEDRDLVDLSARFARGFVRVLDGKGTGGMSYPHLRVLETLHCQGPSTMRPLAERLGLTARNLTAVADALEGDGLLRRVGHPTDRRATILELTDAGMAAADGALAPRFGEIIALFDRLSPADRSQFVGTLTELVDAMEAGCPRDAGCDDDGCPDAAC